MRLTYEQKLSLARAGARCAKDDKGEADFIKLAKKSSVDPEQLAYWANAYESAGESGLKALKVGESAPKQVIEEACHRLKILLQDRFPRLKFEIKKRGKTITVGTREKRWKSGEDYVLPIFQVRYTNHDSRWHLFWRRASGRWWPYIGEREHWTIDDCVASVEEDVHGCFWG